MSQTNFFKSWKWAAAIEGAVIALFGLFAFLFPDFLLKSLTVIIGVAILVFGVVQIANSAALNRQTGSWATGKLVVGIVAAAVGLLFLVRQSTPVGIFATIFGIWALVSGALKMMAAISARQAGASFVWLFVQSFIHIVFGFILIANPWGFTALWVRILGIYILYLGVAYIVSVFTATQEPM